MPQTWLASILAIQSYLTDHVTESILMKKLLGIRAQFKVVLKA